MENLYVVHEHSKYTNLFDKYWKFNTYTKAYIFFKSMVIGYLNDEDYDINDTSDNFLELKKPLFYDLGNNDYINLQILFCGDDADHL